MPRPTRDDILQEASVAIAHAWVKRFDPTNREIDDIAENILGSIDWLHDGYQIMKDLEDSGWMGTMCQAEFFDNVEHLYVQPILDLATKKWADSLPNPMRFGEGDVVIVKDHPGPNCKGTSTGIICAASPDCRMYSVFVSEWGHGKTVASKTTLCSNFTEEQIDEWNPMECPF